LDSMTGEIIVIDVVHVQRKYLWGAP
jgi:hypothetical protein